MRRLLVLATLLSTGLAGLLIGPIGSLSPFTTSASTAPSAQPAVVCGGIMMPCN